MNGVDFTSSKILNSSLMRNGSSILKSGTEVLSDSSGKKICFGETSFKTVYSRFH